MKFLSLVLFWLTTLMPAAMSSELPAGADDPAFQQAVEVWLLDDDANSLPALANLAQGGNRAAQILLGQIEQYSAAPSRWVARLSRDDRRTIFRAPGGKFGKPWLNVAAEDEPLARALKAALDFESSEGIAPLLFAFGEYRAMGPAISRLLNHGEWERLVELGSQRMLPPERIHAAWYAALFVRSGEAFRLKQEAYRDQGTQRLAFIALAGGDHPNWPIPKHRAQYYERLFGWSSIFGHGASTAETPVIAQMHADWILNSGEADQVANACREICPTEPDTCATTVWQALGGYFTFLELGSPVAALIPTEHYVRSKRATGDLLRHLALFPRSEQLAASNSQCLARHLRLALPD